MKGGVILAGGKRDSKEAIINAIVLETGYTKKHVTEVVNSFLAIFQELISDGSVYIGGFGEMIGTMKTRTYFDINQRAMDKKTQPVIVFKPSTSFLRLVKQSHVNSKGGE